MTGQSDPILVALRRYLRGYTFSYNSASAANDIYEGFLFSLVVDTAARCGATVTYRTVRGSSTRNLTFRTSPGRLYSRTHDYTHAVIQFGRAPALEVHIGVRVQGSSGVLHECDILVLAADEANWSRSNSADPRGSKCLLGVECKYYTSPLPLAMARGFVGLRADLSRTQAAFIANIGSPSVNRYLNVRSKGYEFQVLPGTAQTSHFQSLVRNAFKSHTSRHDPGYSI